MEKENVKLSRALVAVMLREIDKLVEEKKFKSRRDFAIKTLDVADQYANFYSLVFGVYNKNYIPRFDMELAQVYANGIGKKLFELVILAQEMVENGTFPHGQVANTEPILKKIPEEKPGFSVDLNFQTIDELLDTDNE